MKHPRLRWPVTAFLSILAALTASDAAGALPQRTFVSPDGNDANLCTLVAPCRTLQRGHDVVADGGDLVILGSAGYGPLMVFHSINILAPDGVYGGISVTSGDGIFVSAGNATLLLRGLTLNGNGTAGRGIYFGPSGVLSVENCKISGFTDTGISSTATQTFVKDSFVRGNDTGIAIGGGHGTIDNVRAENNRIGMRVDTPATATIRNSVAAGNSAHGFFAFSAPGAAIQAVLNLQDSVASNNVVGIEERFSIAMLSNSTFTGNTDTGVAALGGFVYSRQNNTVFNNTTDVAATITPLPPI